MKRFSTGEESAQAVAKACGINKASFCAYLRSHHPDLIENRQKVRSRQLAEINQLRKKADESARAEYELEKALHKKYEIAADEIMTSRESIETIAAKYLENEVRRP
ncbi:MAG: hypothetical protein IJ795_02210 [Bacteroidales bacterium]|nr:hypothetical protein [Bacteroidales bacterium]